MLRKTLVAVAFSIGGVLATTQVATADVIDFTGHFDPANWLVSFTGSPPGGGPPASVSQDSSTATITGGDSGCAGGVSGVAGPCAANLTIDIGRYFHLISFDWTYTTNDVDGPGFDLFGYLLNGVFTQLSDPGGPPQQFGSFAMSFNNNDVFGFSVNCTDCVGGAANVVISNFLAVPEPGTLALLGLGLAGLAGGLHRRRLN